MIQHWTINQWRLVYEMIKSNEWKIIRYIDEDKNDQTNVSLSIYGTLETVLEYERVFGGVTVRPQVYGRRGLSDYRWRLDHEELDDFLDNLWILLSKKDPHGRLTDVRQAQDIRKKVREGNSYPFYDPRSTKGR